jgi:hypothetical protein
MIPKFDEEASLAAKTKETALPA